MINKPHIVNFMNGMVLTLVSLFSYFSNPARPFTALIGAIVGIGLISLTSYIIKGNKTVAHILVGVTFLFAITTGIMGFKSSKNPELDELTRSRRMIVFAIMSGSCLGSTGYYIMGFIDRKKRMKLEESQNL